MSNEKNETKQQDDESPLNSYQLENANICKMQETCSVLMELLQKQWEVNGVLWTNVFLIGELKLQPQIPSEKVSLNDRSTSASKKLTRQNQFQMIKLEIKQDNNRQENHAKRRKIEKDLDYIPSDSQPNFQENQSIQTKNIPKNYGNSILVFIRKSEKYVNFVLEQCGVDCQEFKQFVESRRTKLTSIADFRFLWTNSQANKFAKPLRIISAEYLRKYSLSYIFNSRIQKFMRNIKYRRKFLKALENPEQFTLIKDF